MKLSLKKYCRGVSKWLFLLTSLILLLSCSLEDDRDECCWKNTVCFHYMYAGNDCFQQYIHVARWFLFDADGNFMGERDHMPCCPQRVYIGDLPVGEYSLVCVGNLDDCGSLEGHMEKGLDSFHLKVDDCYDKQNHFSNGDRLYWGMCHFKVVSGDPNCFVGEMSNVHCELHVHVEWELVPPFSDGYRLVLGGVGTGMELCDNRADSIDGYHFPPVTSFSGSMAEKKELRRFSLNFNLVTLRWGKEHIPDLCLWHLDEPVTKVIELEDIFRRWDWHPEHAPVQEYFLCLKICQDGRIIVSHRLASGVKDWEDGGVIGG